MPDRETVARKFDRREVGALAAGAVLASACGREADPIATSDVSIVSVPDYSADLLGVVRRIFVEHRLDLRGKSVVIKPNLVEFDPETPINTNPLLTSAVLEACRSLGAAAVTVAEGPGHRRLTLDLAESAGYFEAIANFENHFVDLNVDAIREVTLRSPFSKLSKLYLPETLLAADVLISLPKLKTHHWVGATLSMKNLFGVVPSGVYGWPKNVLHWAGINECIADLAFNVTPQFCLVDGIVGMQGNGPIQGVAKSAGVLVAGSSPIAVDETCCRIMGIAPEKIAYLRLAAARMGAVEPHQIAESISAVQTNFDLPPNMDFLRITRDPATAQV